MLLVGVAAVALLSAAAASWVSQAGGAAPGVPSTTIAVALRSRDRAIEPAEVEPPLLGLHCAPRELGEPHRVEPGTLHQLEVVSQRASGHCSGYQATPKESAGQSANWVARACQSR
jgi:hypothetical protein